MNLNGFFSREKIYQINIFLISIVFIGWLFVVPRRSSLLNQSFSYLMSVLVAVLVISSLVSLFKDLSKLNKYSKIFFTLNAFIWLIFLIFLYPGIFSTDFFSLVLAVSGGHTMSWFSNAYSIIVMTLGVFEKNYFAVSAFSFFLLNGIIFRLLKKFPIKNFWQSGFLVFIFNLPVLHWFLYFTYRDVFVALFTAHIVLIICEMFENKDYGLMSLYELGFMTLLSALVREDAKVYLIVIPVALCMLCRTNYKKFLLTGFINILLYIAITVSWTFSKVETADIYLATGLIVPLNVIVRNAEVPLTEEQKASIDAIVSYKDLLLHTDDYYPMELIPSVYRENHTKSQWNSFVFTYIELVLDNKVLFLKNRINSFFLANNILRGGYFFYENMRESEEYFKANGRPDYFIKSVDFFKKIKQSYYSIIYRLEQSEVIMIRLLFASTFVFFCLSLIVFIFSKEKLLISCLFLIIVSKNFVVFLTAPAPHFKYYGTFLFPVLVLLCIFITKIIDAKEGKVALDNLNSI